MIEKNTMKLAAVIAAVCAFGAIGVSAAYSSAVIAAAGGAAASMNTVERANNSAARSSGVCAAITSEAKKDGFVQQATIEIDTLNQQMRALIQEKTKDPSNEITQGKFLAILSGHKSWDAMLKMIMQCDGDGGVISAGKD